MIATCSVLYSSPLVVSFFLLIRVYKFRLKSATSVKKWNYHMMFRVTVQLAVGGNALPPPPSLLGHVLILLDMCRGVQIGESVAQP